MGSSEPREYVVHELDTSSQDKVDMLSERIERLEEAIRNLGWIIAEAGNLWLPAGSSPGIQSANASDRQAGADHTPPATAPRQQPLTLFEEDGCAN